MKFNKGEWSELFVVAKIFSNNNIRIAHSHNHMKVIKVYFNNREITYTVDDAKIDRNDNKTYPLETYEDVHMFLSELSNSTGSSFSLVTGNQFMDKYDIVAFKEVVNKGDINTYTIFPNESAGRDVNFSIKSFIGNPPTLLNSSQATNFIFEIENFTGNANRINAIATRSKIKDRLAEIREHSTNLKIISVEDSVFLENMMKIDTNFLYMIAPIVLNFYSSQLNTVVSLVENTDNVQFSQDIISMNVKYFLRAFALGMVPKKPWNGDNVTGGSIIVSTEGELAAYTLYDMDIFDEFLYRHCKLDTPSSTRHKFGEIYLSEGKYYIKLNLQIRFI